MSNGITGERLKSFIERIERLEEEKAVFSADIKDVKSEAKSAGFDTKIIFQIVRIRKMDPQDWREQQELLGLYMHAIGMDASTTEIKPTTRSDAEPDADIDEKHVRPFEGSDPHPDIDQRAARKMAKQAHDEGKRLSDNPFQKGTPLYSAWESEWNRREGMLRLSKASVLSIAPIN